MALAASQFELEIPNTARADLDFHGNINVSDPATAVSLVDIDYCCAWRWPEVPVVVENPLSRTEGDPLTKGAFFAFHGRV